MLEKDENGVNYLDDYIVYEAFCYINISATFPLSVNLVKLKLDKHER